MEYTIRHWLRLVEMVEPDYDLKAKYHHFNRLVFDGTLPDIPVIWAQLKNVGGDARAKMRHDPTKPPPNRLMVRLGSQDKYADREIVPGSLNIRVSTLYRRSEQAIDQILLHEMIHIHLMVTGHLGEGHGMLFQRERRRVSRLVGFDVPLKDSVAGFELAADVNIKPYGVILIEKKDGGYQYAMFSAKQIMMDADAIRTHHEHFVKYNYYTRVALYTIADETWSQQAMKTKVQRKFARGRTPYYRLTDQAAIDDLRQNGKLLVAITQENIT